MSKASQNRAARRRGLQPREPQNKAPAQNLTTVQTSMQFSRTHCHVMWSRPISNLTMTPEHTEAFAQDLLNLAKAQREAVAGMVLQETKEAIPPEQTVVPVRKEASHG